MRCISFSGSSKPALKRYRRGDTIWETDLVQEALYRLYKPDSITLCISEPGSAHIAAALESRNIPVEKIWIPTGNGENDLWNIFSLLCENVQEGEEILFDVTSGCHVFPFVTFGAAAYVRSVKKVRIKGILYGTPVSGETDLVQLVELTPLLHLLDWINGMHAFSEYVDAQTIQELLKQIQGEIHRKGTEPDPPTHLTGWSHLLGTFTSAVRLSRPVSAQYAAEGICRDLDVIENEITRFAPSLGPVMKDIGALRELAASPPPEKISRTYMQGQLALIQYQIQKGLILQAVTLAREWLISETMIRFGIENEWLDSEIRHQISRTLTGMALALQKKDAEKTEYSEKIYQIPEWKEMIQIWTRISDLRNDLAHCGMNTRDESIPSLERRGMQIITDLEKFFLITSQESDSEGSHFSYSR